MILQMNTERLLLRKMEAADANELFQIWSDPLVTEFMNIENFTSKVQALEMIQLFDQLHQDQAAIRYSIIELDTGELIGSCGFNFVDHEHAKAEVAYDISQKHWRRGFAVEAVSALVQHGFLEMQLNRIEAKVDPNNEPSIRLLERLNFHYEGTLRETEIINDVFFDLTMYSRLKSD